MAVVTMRQLLESGVHFGHQTRRWNPKMKRFIFTERNGIYIIDLRQTVDYINKAYDFVKNTVAEGGSILFVGTKKQAQEAVSEQASRVGMPYVNHRWLGGMLTNFQTVHKRLVRMKELESLDLSGTAEGYTKKETLHLSREKAKLTRTLGGLRDMQRLPAAIWVVDTKKEHIAVDEARKLGIPVIAILDTNCDPDEVDFPIPGNDDAIRSADLLTKIIASAVADGVIARAGAARGGEDKPEPGVIGADEPLAEWERELLVGDQAPAGRAAAPGQSAGAQPATTRTPPAAAEPSAPAAPAEPATTAEPATPEPATPEPGLADPPAAAAPADPPTNPPAPSADPPAPSADPPAPSADPPAPSADPPAPSADPPAPSADPPGGSPSAPASRTE
jgi:small subunit ribosomal protein S2